MEKGFEPNCHGEEDEEAAQEPELESLPNSRGPKNQKNGHFILDLSKCSKCGGELKEMKKVGVNDEGGDDGNGSHSRICTCSSSSPPPSPPMRRWASASSAISIDDEEEEEEEEEEEPNLKTFDIPLSDLIDERTNNNKCPKGSSGSSSLSRPSGCQNGRQGGGGGAVKLSCRIFRGLRKIHKNSSTKTSAGLTSTRDDDGGRETPPLGHTHPSSSRIRTFKRTLRNWFKSRNRNSSSSNGTTNDVWLESGGDFSSKIDSSATPQRALPPLPSNDENENSEGDEELPIAFGIVDDIPPVPGTAFFPDDEEFDELDKNREDDSSSPIDIATSIQTVKDFGWYWGPISGEVAERLLENEPDGSFVVRDSSAQDYIFSLTVKLNNVVRHVRIEHGKGNFSFGSSTRFKSSTIGDFIENAVEHSRSGRYLFFLHRRPELGPMRVQLLHPVSRFKQVQSLQHLARFIILEHISRDQLHELPVPKRIQEYLNTPFYYSEKIDDTFTTAPAD